MARSTDPLSYATVVTYVYSGGIPSVLTPNDRAVREIEDVVGIAERSGDDLALIAARMTLGGWSPRSPATSSWCLSHPPETAIPVDAARSAAIRPPSNLPTSTGETDERTDDP
jgi:hypothetical protein